MFRSGRKKLLSILLVVAVMGSSLVAMSPGTASGVITATATAVPGMFSVWGFGLLPQPQFDPGPSYTTLIVTGVDSSATVTVDVTSMIDAIFPNLPARISMFPQSTRDAYEAHRTSLANSPFVWDDALNAWTHQLGKELTPSSPSPAVRAVAESMLFEEARLGTVIVNVKVRVGVETKTIPVKVTVVDMERPMLPGWNLASTPVALGINTMGNIANLGDKLDYDLAVRWDPVTQVWKNVFASQVVSPLDAMYVRARSFTQMGLVFSRNNTTPPTEQVLARGSGWNLMGPSLVKGRNGTGDDSYFEMPLVSALKSIEGKYDAVVSPGESWAFTQEYRTAGGAVVDTHDWSFNQDAWVYLAGDAAVPQMTVGGGYWVHSTSDGSLAGLTQTPLSFAGWNPFD